MGEKKTSKISLSTVLLIIAIIIMIAMGIYINTLYKNQSALNEKISSLNREMSDSTSNTDLETDMINTQITGTYYQKNAHGDEPAYTFSENNIVTYGALWMCSGTYTINHDVISIYFTSAVDPDGNAASIGDYDVQESVELTIMNENTLKDNFNGSIYLK